MLIYLWTHYSRGEQPVPLIPNTSLRLVTLLLTEGIIPTPEKSLSTENVSTGFTGDRLTIPT